MGNVPGGGAGAPGQGKKDGKKDEKKDKKLNAAPRTSVAGRRKKNKRKGRLRLLKQPRKQEYIFYYPGFLN